MQHNCKCNDSSLYVPQIATIESVEQLGDREKVFDISIDSGKSLGQQAGQFVELTVFGMGEAPISVAPRRHAATADSS